jgi:hypothetical protein
MGEGLYIYIESLYAFSRRAAFKEASRLQRPRTTMDNHACATKSGLMWFSCENLKLKLKKV